jgi:enterochelin esterase family protein
MRSKVAYGFGIAGALVAGVAIGQVAQKESPDSHYHLGPDSLVEPGVPKGEIQGPFVIKSDVYPGTQHTYWVYVPAQYDPKKAAALMVFQDGQAFKQENGGAHGNRTNGSL